MARLRLTRLARADLHDIGRYTRQRWGDEQCTIYLTRLDAALRTLAETPHIGRERPDIRPGLRSHPHERHVVFYRIDGADLVVLRVLHHARDVRHAGM